MWHFLVDTTGLFEANKSRLSLQQSLKSGFGGGGGGSPKIFAVEPGAQTLSLLGD